MLKKIRDKKIIVGVIGMGYVGLPLALEYALNGVKTIGFELDKTKVEMLNKGINYNQEDRKSTRLNSSHT